MSLRHPGSLVLETIVRPHYGNVTAFARRLGLARSNLSRLVNSEVGLSLPLARRLERLGHGKARDWLILQLDWDLENK